MTAAVKAKTGTRGRRASPKTPAPERPGPLFITVNTAAAMLSLHPMSIRKLINRGQIVAVHIGRAVRVDLRKLEAQLEAQAQGKRT